MESPCPPPQRRSSLSQANPAPAVGPAPSPSTSSPASAGSQPTPVASTSATASAEPRQQQQQQRKRPLSAVAAAEGAGDLECGVEADRAAAALAGHREVGAGGGLSVPQEGPGSATRRRAQSQRAVWVARSVREGGGSGSASARGLDDALRPREKRRRVEEDVDENECAAQAGHRAARPSGTRRRRLSHLSSSLLIEPAYGCATAPPLACISPSLYLGVFPTPFAAVDAPEPSSTQPPAPSPRLAPPSARPAQGAFPVSSIDMSTSVSPRPRRRANSLPLPGQHSPSSSSSQRSLAPISTSFPSALPPVPASPLVDQGRCSGGTAERQRRSLAPSACDSPSSAPALLTQDDLIKFHAGRIHCAHDETACGEFSAVSLAPPVTRATLRELDLHEIMRNPQLRHDVVFDPNLMFRPNYDGQRGERKRLLAAQYWTAVTREIDTGCRCTTIVNGAVLPCICLPADPAATPCLPTLASRLPSRIAPLIAELRNIFFSLLPAPSAPPSPELSSSATFATTSSSTSSCVSSYSPTDASRQQLVDVLDPEHLMQQLERGCADIPSLARFLGATVKQHCAPMRDDLVDAMVEACEGRGLAKGLEMCFEILELMKLDIANHQLRSLRPYLVQTALDFERRVYHNFAGRRRGPGSFDHIRAWLHSSAAASVDGKKERRTLGKDELVEQAVTQGLLDLVFPAEQAAPLSSVATLPETLQLDSYRIQAFQSDATDLTVVYLLMMLFGQLAYPARPSPAEVDSLREELWCIMASSARSPTSLVGPAAATQGIPQGPPGLGLAKLESATWRAGMQDVLLQVARRATEVRARAGRAGTTTARATVPDAETLALVSSYFETNVCASSKLFQLLQRRLHETLRAVVIEELEKERALGPMSFTSWWAPQLEAMPMATGTARRTVASSMQGARPHAGMMASSMPQRGVKRSRPAGDDDCAGKSADEDADERQRIDNGKVPSQVDVALQRNGLGALSSEVRLLGMRIARVAAFNLAVYRPLYSTWLSIPPPSPSCPTPHA